MESTIYVLIEQLDGKDAVIKFGSTTSEQPQYYGGEVKFASINCPNLLKSDVERIRELLLKDICIEAVSGLFYLKIGTLDTAIIEQSTFNGIACWKPKGEQGITLCSKAEYVEVLKSILHLLIEKCKIEYSPKDGLLLIKQ